MKIFSNLRVQERKNEKKTHDLQLDSRCYYCWNNVQHQLDLTKPASPIDTLRGNFATEPEEYNVLFSFESEDHSFIQYHESTLVDEGTYVKINDNAYLLKSDLQDTYFVLQEDNSFYYYDTILSEPRFIKMIYGSSATVYFDQTYYDKDSLND